MADCDNTLQQKEQSTPSGVLAGERRTYYLVTYGCQKNEYDSEVIAALVEALGFRPVESADDAALIILNTCCVRDNADQKVYGRVGQYKRLKDRNPELILIVTGCLAQKDGEALVRRFSYLDAVIGTHNLDRLQEVILKRNRRHHVLCRLKGPEFDLLPVKRTSSFTGLIPISEGCDCRCTFCIIPSVRGDLKSRSPESILKDVRHFVSTGGVEVTLLGQNVNSYGKDSGGSIDFADLLKEVNAVEGLRRIRFKSPHPEGFTEDFVKRMSELEKVCRHVHLPLQSGDDTILRRMGRRYTTARYRESLLALRRYMPDISVTTDIIVGFPGETEEQFENTMNFIKELQFDGAFMFAYSEREGTAAVKIGRSVPPEQRMARLYRLIELQNEICLCRNRQYEGSVEEVLVESVSKKKKAFLTGRTGRNKVVNFEGEESRIGEIFQVTLTHAYTWGFLGRMTAEGAGKKSVADFLHQ